MRLIRSICFSLLTMLLLTAPARAETTLDDLLNAADIGSNAVVIDGVRRGMDVDSCDEAGPVSYTHLTLPTNREV